VSIRIRKGGACLKNESCAKEVVISGGCFCSEFGLMSSSSWCTRHKIPWRSSKSPLRGYPVVHYGLCLHIVEWINDISHFHGISMSKTIIVQWQINAHAALEYCNLREVNVFCPSSYLGRFSVLLVQPRVAFWRWPLISLRSWLDNEALVTPSDSQCACPSTVMLWHRRLWLYSWRFSDLYPSSPTHVLTISLHPEASQQMFWASGPWWREL